MPLGKETKSDKESLEAENVQLREDVQRLQADNKRLRNDLEVMREESALMSALFRGAQPTLEGRIAHAKMMEIPSSK